MKAFWPQGKLHTHIGIIISLTMVCVFDNCVYESVTLSTDQRLENYLTTVFLERKHKRFYN